MQFNFKKTVSTAIAPIAAAGALGAAFLPVQWWFVLKGGGKRPYVERKTLSAEELNSIKNESLKDMAVEDWAYQQSGETVGFEPVFTPFRKMLAPNLKLLETFHDGGFSTSAFRDDDGKLYIGVAGMNFDGVPLREMLIDVPEAWRFTANNVLANTANLKKFIEHVTKKYNHVPDVIVSHSSGTLPVIGVMAYGEELLPKTTRICLMESPGVTDNTIADLAKFIKRDEQAVEDNILERENTVSLINGSTQPNALGTQPGKFVSLVDPNKDGFWKWDIARIKPHIWGNLLTRAVEIVEKNESIYQGRDGREAGDPAALTATCILFAALSGALAAKTTQVALRK